eukprot:TRINITY_DN8889_c0_g1_i1.p1 TRINITY_DN8889_c0_g1~~TRINITY_DN8889_c0_g1_i1.p1  ORF type:complete len:284 (+),score=71.73 TRINITY_DN8889_c0_g1_i1:43-852(+)
MAAEKAHKKEEVVLFEKRGNVAVITINRPTARNAVSQAVADGIEAAIDKLEADDSLWVGVLTGHGKVFCAGADLKAISSGKESLMTKRGGFAGIVQRQRTKPIIAAVGGAALAGGCEIVLACDMTIASANASFGLPEVKRSLVAGAGGLFRLPRRMPAAIAMELCLTGDPISAERAAHFGLINKVVPENKALEEAMELAERICVNAPLAVRASRKVVVEGTYATDEVAWKITGEAFKYVATTEDYKEGPRAFIEKRPPKWTGKAPVARL